MEELQSYFNLNQINQSSMGGRQSVQLPPQIITKYVPDKKLEKKCQELSAQIASQNQELKKIRQNGAKLIQAAANTTQIEKIQKETQQQIKRKTQETDNLRDQVADMKRLLQHSQKRAQDEQKKWIQVNEKLQQQMRDFSAQEKKAKEQAKKLSDPQHFKTKKNQIFVAFLANLKSYQFTDKLEKTGKRYHIIIGNISVGKSSLLNRLLDLKLNTGMGETTLKVSKVAESQHTIIFDSPGANNDFDFYDVENLNLFHSVDRVFILYNTSLKDVTKIIQIMEVIKPNNTYLIRTQCDLFEGKSDQKTLDQELKVDREYLSTITKIEFPILTTSSKKDMKYLDNQKTKALLFDQP